MKKKVGIIKRLTCLCLIFLLSINSFAAIVSDNDGSAFITKAEFDALKSSFQSQIDSYNQSIDTKIDGAIASYLAGIKLSTKIEITPVLDKIVNSKGIRNYKAQEFTQADDQRMSIVDTSSWLATGSGSVTPNDWTAGYCTVFALNTKNTIANAGVLDFDDDKIEDIGTEKTIIALSGFAFGGCVVKNGYVDILNKGNGDEIANGTVYSYTPYCLILNAKTPGIWSDGDFYGYSPSYNSSFNGLVKNKIANLSIDQGSWAKTTFVGNQFILSGSYDASSTPYFYFTGTTSKKVRIQDHDADYFAPAWNDYTHYNLWDAASGSGSIATFIHAVNTGTRPNEAVLAAALIPKFYHAPSNTLPATTRNTYKGLTATYSPDTLKLAYNYHTGAAGTIEYLPSTNGLILFQKEQISGCTDVSFKIKFTTNSADGSALVKFGLGELGISNTMQNTTHFYKMKINGGAEDYFHNLNKDTEYTIRVELPQDAQDIFMTWMLSDSTNGGTLVSLKDCIATKAN